MARKCKDCDTILSLYNQGQLCWPCQEEKKEQLQEQIGDTPHYTVENLCLLLGYANPESVKRLGRKGKIPGKIPEIRKHLYLREDVDQWLCGEQQEAPTEAIIAQKPYEETPHKQKMRKLAKTLATISLPSVMDSFKMSQNEPGSYSLLCNDDVFFVIEFENREIAAFAELEGTGNAEYESAEENFAWKALLSHLEAGEYLGIIDKIKYFKPKMDAYFECCHEFLKLVKEKFEGDTGLLVPSDYSETFGFTPFFAIFICVDAVQTYDGLYSIKDSSYRIEEKGSDWALTCDGIIISIDDSKETLSIFEEMHKGLRLEFTSGAKKEQTVAIDKIRKDLEDTVKAVRDNLFAFAGKDTLPGHCELC